MVQVQSFKDDVRYGLEILLQCNKRVKAKRQRTLSVILTFKEVTGEKIAGGNKG